MTKTGTQHPDNLRQFSASNNSSSDGKMDIALLYMKRSSYLTQDNCSEYFEIHATAIVDDKRFHIFDKYNIINHRAVSGEVVQKLLSKSKLFVGVGFPYEGVRIPYKREQLIFSEENQL